MLNRIPHIFAFLFILATACEQKADEDKLAVPIPILNENFDSNKLGWAEEYTEAHKTEIKNGNLYIFSYDTTAVQSSNGPTDNSFLLGFPNSYEISSSITLMTHSRHARFGILLVSSSLEYKFSVSDSGTAAVMEWDANRKTEIRLFTHPLNTSRDTGMKHLYFEINVHYRNFEFYVNNEIMGEGILNSRSWEGIRLFTTTGSSIAVDYLRIKKVD